MWNEEKSARLSRVCVAAVLVLTAAACVTAPFLVQRLAGVQLINGRTVGQVRVPLLAALYLCAALAAAALWDLRALLILAAGQEVFCARSVLLLRRLSWYCFGAAAVLLAAAFPAWPPLALLCAAAGFMGLILRVLKNVFVEAVRLKTENDYTI